MAIQNKQELFQAFVTKVLEQDAIREDLAILKEEAKEAKLGKEDIAEAMRVAKVYVKSTFDDETSKFEAFQAAYAELTQ